MISEEWVLILLASFPNGLQPVEFVRREEVQVAKQPVPVMQPVEHEDKTHHEDDRVQSAEVSHF